MTFTNIRLETAGGDAGGLKANEQMEGGSDWSGDLPSVSWESKVSWLQTGYSGFHKKLKYPQHTSAEWVGRTHKEEDERLSGVS